jgi:hypothetical protein
VIGVDHFRSAVALERHPRKIFGQPGTYGLRSLVFEFAEAAPDSAFCADEDLIPTRLRGADDGAATTSRAFEIQNHDGSPWMNGGDSVLLHPVHAFGLKIPVDLIEIESRVEVRQSPVPPKTQRSAIDVLIFDLHISDASNGRQHFTRRRTHHIDFARSRCPFHHHRTAHYFPLLQGPTACACGAEQQVRNIGDPAYATSGVHCVKCNTVANGNSAHEPHK